jgi:hypothetical protein
MYRHLVANDIECDVIDPSCTLACQRYSEGDVRCLCIGYAQMKGEPLNSASWAKVVRAGNTARRQYVDDHRPRCCCLKRTAMHPARTSGVGQGGGSIEVLAHAQSVTPIHRVDIIWNGRVAASREHREGTREITLKENVRVPGSGWLAARCSSKLNLRLVAHTSPIYVQVPGRDTFSETAATYMLTQIEAVQSWVETPATRPDSERFERVRKVFTDALAILHRRLHEHKVKH